MCQIFSFFFFNCHVFLYNQCIKNDHQVLNFHHKDQQLLLWKRRIWHNFFCSLIIFWRTFSTANVSLHIQTSVTAGSFTLKALFLKKMVYQACEPCEEHRGPSKRNYIFLLCASLHTSCRSIHIPVAFALYTAVAWYVYASCTLFSILYMISVEQRRNCRCTANRSFVFFSLTLESCSWQHGSMEVWHFPSLCQKPPALHLFVLASMGVSAIRNTTHPDLVSLPTATCTAGHY